MGTAAAAGIESRDCNAAVRVGFTSSFLSLCQKRFARFAVLIQTDLLLIRSTALEADSYREPLGVT
jgi:hypothetical protein